MQSSYLGPILEHNRKIINQLTHLEIPIIDIYVKVFINQQEPLSLFPNQVSGYYNEIGYELTSVAIFEFIEKIYEINE